MDEVPDAFDFRITGEQPIDGRDAWIIEGTRGPAIVPVPRWPNCFPSFAESSGSTKPIING